MNRPQSLASMPIGSPGSHNSYPHNSDHNGNFNHNLAPQNNPNNNSDNDHNLVNDATYDAISRAVRFLAPRYFEPMHLQSNQQIYDIAVFFTTWYLSSPPDNFNVQEIRTTGCVWLDCNRLFTNDPLEVQTVPNMDDLQNSLEMKPATVIPTLSLAMHVLAIIQAQIELDEVDAVFAFSTLITRIRHYPTMINPSQIGSQFINRFVSFPATITRLSESRPLIYQMPYKCTACSQIIDMKFSDGNCEPPEACPMGCRGRTFTAMRTLGQSVDWQQVTVQEVMDSESSNNGRIPSLIEAELMRDLVSSVRVGDQVQITGIVKARNPDRGFAKKNSYVVYLEVNAVHTQTQNNILSTLQDKTNKLLTFGEENTKDSKIEGEIIEDILPFDHPLNDQPLLNPNNNNPQSQLTHAQRTLREYILKRKQFIHLIAQQNYYFAAVLLPLYLPVEAPPITAGGYNITANDMKGIAYIHKHPNLIKNLVHSLCESIYGHTSAKFGILLALVGGVDRSELRSPQDISISQFNQFLHDNGILFTTQDSNSKDENNLFNAMVDIELNGHHNNDQKLPNFPLFNHLVPNLYGGVTSMPTTNSNGFNTHVNNSNLTQQQPQQHHTKNSLDNSDNFSTQSHFKTRSNIHILLIGEPGLGKSQLLRQVSVLSPRGVYVSGNGSSNAGLTASLSKEGRGFSLEPGALVIGDRGVTCIDELDKLQQQHKSLLECMEQQTVSITKAGTVCQLAAATTVIAAANPKGGTYDRSKGLMENLNLNAILLSRFDLCFLMLDTGGKDFDSLLSTHVIGMHTDENPQQRRVAYESGMAALYAIDNEMTPAGAKHSRFSIHSLSTPEKAEQFNIHSQLTQNSTHHPGHTVARPGRFFEFPIPTNTFEPSSQPQQQYTPPPPPYEEVLSMLGYDPSHKLSQRYHLSLQESKQFDRIPSWLIKKYIAFARHYCRPTISPHARTILQEFFLTLRGRAGGMSANNDPNVSTSASNAITTRQLESLIRLCEARAKLELRPMALSIDAYEAVEVMRETMFSLFMG